MVSRPDQLSEGGGIFVFFDAMFYNGSATSFSAYFSEPAQNFKFQIWRPDEAFITTRTFQLIAEITARNSTRGLYIVSYGDVKYRDLNISFIPIYLFHFKYYVLCVLRLSSKSFMKELYQ